jgi:hypothetical protein
MVYYTISLILLSMVSAFTFLVFPSSFKGGVLLFLVLLAASTNMFYSVSLITEQIGYAK